MPHPRLAALLSALLMASSLATAGIVLGASPTLTVTPDDTTITVGDPTNATADISGYVAGDGTGTITIALFSDSGCTTPVDSVNEGFTPVSADGSFGPLSSAYATAAVGSLWWGATYDGDDNNDPTASTCVEVTVAKATPTVTVIPDDTTITVGDPTNAKAVLSGSYSATGNLTIALFSDSGCSALVGRATTEGFTVAGDGTYGPLASAYTTTAVGSLWWGATYDGDDNNEPASDCVEVSVAKATPSVTTTPSPSSVDPAPESLSDRATLSGGYAPTGSIEFNLFPPSDPTCAGVAAYTETVTVDGNGDYDTTGTGTGSDVADLAGVWRWTADYSGDDNNDPDSSGCGDEEVPVYVDTSVVYAGQTYDANGGSTTVSANLASIDPACLTGDVMFVLTPVGGSGLTPIAVANVSPSTYVSATPTLGAGIFEVDIDFDPTDPYCNPSADVAVLTVVGPGDSANGGGWYRNLDFTPSRVNFGFTVQKQVNRKTGVVTYRGQLLWLNGGTDGWRLKGTVFSVGDPFAYGTFDCPGFVGVPGTSNPKCGSFGGSGVLQAWDAEANGGLGDWVDSSYGPVSFTVIVYDGGSMNVCKGKRNCTKQDLTDWFGIQIDPVPGTVVPEAAPIMLKGGSIKVS